MGRHHEGRGRPQGDSGKVHRPGDESEKKSRDGRKGERMSGSPMAKWRWVGDPETEREDIEVRKARAQDQQYDPGRGRHACRRPSRSRRGKTDGNVTDAWHDRSQSRVTPGVDLWPCSTRVDDCGMRDLHKQERIAIEAVARRFSATWEKGSDPPDAYILVAGKRVDADITTLKRRGTDQGRAKPRLRFDKVATRLIDRLQATLGATAPDGMTVLLTVTAPIRLPSKTAAALEEKIQTLLGRGSPRRDERDTIHGNRVQIRISRDESGRAPRMIGFVHNSDSDPLLLLNMTRELLELSRGEAGRAAATLAGDRWLVVMSARESSCLEAYRYIYSQLRMATDFKKILMVFGDGRVGLLTG